MSAFIISKRRPHPSGKLQLSSSAGKQKALNATGVINQSISSSQTQSFIHLETQSSEIFHLWQWFVFNLEVAFHPFRLNIVPSDLRVLVLIPAAYASSERWRKPPFHPAKRILNNVLQTQHWRCLVCTFNVCFCFYCWTPASIFKGIIEFLSSFPYNHKVYERIYLSIETFKNVKHSSLIKMSIKFMKIASSLKMINSISDSIRTGNGLIFQQVIWLIMCCQHATYN